MGITRLHPGHCQEMSMIYDDTFDVHAHAIMSGSSLDPLDSLNTVNTLDTGSALGALGAIITFMTNEAGYAPRPLFSTCTVMTGGSLYMTYIMPVVAMYLWL